MRKAAGAPAVYEVPRFLPSRTEARQVSAVLRNGTESFEQSATALNTLFANGVLSPDEFASRLSGLARGEATRSGRVLSAENERRLRAAHDHCMAACDHVMSVVEQNHKPDDPDAEGDGSDEDPEQASLDVPQSEIRARRVRLLRLAQRS